MVQWLNSQGADDRVVRQYSPIVTNLKRRVTVRHAVAYHVMGHLLAHLFDGVAVVDRDE